MDLKLKLKLNFISNSKSHKKFFNFFELKNYQFKKLYKIVDLNISNIFKITKSINTNLHLSNLMKFKNLSKLRNDKFLKFKLNSFNNQFLKLKSKSIIKVYNIVNFLNSSKLRKLLIKKYRFNKKVKRLNLLKFLINKHVLKLNSNCKIKSTFKSIYKNKWWFYFLNRIYPYISTQFYRFKFFNLIKKIFKFLIKFNFKKLIIKITYNKIIKIIKFLFTINKLLNLLLKINKKFNNWLIVKYQFTKHFNSIYYNIIHLKFFILIIFLKNFYY